MPDGDLSERQIKFLEEFVGIPKYFGKDKARKKRARYETEFKRFNTRRDAVASRIGKIGDGDLEGLLRIELNKAEGIVEAGKKKPDFEGGTAQLNLVNQTIGKYLLVAKVKARLPEIQKMVESALLPAPEKEGRLDSHEEIAAIWGYGSEKAQKGIAQTDETLLNAALAAFDKVLNVIAKAAPVIGEAAGAVSSAMQGFAARQKLGIARGLHGSARTRASETADKLKTDFDGKVPPALKAKLAEAKKALDAAPKDDTGPSGEDTEAETKRLSDNGDAVRKSADEAVAALDALDKEAATLLAAYETWKTDRAAFMDRHATMHRHPRRTHAKVAPMVQAADKGLKEADQKAAAFDYAAASVRIGEALTECEKAILDGDDWAELAIVSRDRKERIDSLADGTTLAHDEAKQAIAGAKLLYRDAVNFFNAGEMRRCTDNLDKVPAAVEKANELTKLSRTYTSRYVGWGNRLTALEGMSEEVKKALEPDLAREKKTWADAECPAGGDLKKSLQALALFNWSLSSLEGRAAEAKGYHDALAAFDIRYKEVEDRDGDGGRIAIEEFYLKMKTDREFAVEKAKAKEFVMATKALDASKADHAAKLALADIAKDHLARKKALTEKVKELRGKEGAAAGEEALKRVEALIASASATGVGGNWPGSIETLKQAEAQATLAETLMEDIGEVAAAKDAGKLDGVTDTSSFDAAYDVFTAVHDKVKSNGDGTFTDKLDAAKTKADAARALAHSGDVTKASADLRTAVADCEAVMSLIGTKRGYDSRLAGVKTQHGTTLPGLNTDDCIKSEIEDIGNLVKAAETLAKAPGLNFAGADAKLAEAYALIRQAEVNAAAYARLKADKTTLEALKTYLDTDARRDGVDTELDRVKDLIREIESAVAARDLKTAAAKAKEGAALDTGYRKFADDYVDAKAERKRRLTDQLHFIQGKPICADELAEVLAIDAEIDKLFAARAYAIAHTMANKAANLIVKGYNLDIDNTAMQPVKTQAETDMTAFAGRHKNKVPPAVDKEAETDGIHDKAKAEIDLRKFKAATALYTRISTEISGMDPLIVAFEECEKAREEAGDLMGQVGKLANKEAVEPLVSRLRGKHANAVKAQDAAKSAGEYTTVKATFEEIKADAQKALDAAAKEAEYAKDVADIKALGSGDSEGLKTAIGKAEKAVADLRDAPDSFYIHPDIQKAEQALRLAKEAQATDVEEAKKKLAEALDHCGTGHINLGHYAQLNSSADFARTRVADFLGSHSEADFVRADMEKIREEVDRLMVDLRGEPMKRSATQTRIEELMALFHRLRATADAQKAYVVKRDEVANGIIQMERHKARHALKPQPDTVKTELASANSAADNHDHPGAMRIIGQARSVQLDALLNADMEAGTVPTADQIKAILEGPGGVERLDKVIAKLDASAQRKVVRAAFEARYGCKLNIYKDTSHETALENWSNANPNASMAQYEAKRQQLAQANISPDLRKKAPNILRLYKVMEDLPPSDTLDNDSMLVFTNVEGPAKGSDYSGYFKEVSMREGPFDQSGYYGIARPNELETIDDNCKPEDGELLTFFDWNTLHEVGHAVDDQQSYMDRNGKALAGWVEYGGNVRPIAEAVAGELKYDEGYIAAYMSGTADPPVPEPHNCTPEEWERRRAAARIWVDRARSTNDPWQTASAAKQCTIGGTTYQESYPGTWTSYRADARNQGVSGYQFRAPGEWFSELYAAYHSERMNKAHPARDWLSKL